MSEPATKTIDAHFRDWEADAFGFGYGSGEPHVIPALKSFLAAVPRQYDYAALEAAVGPVVAWLFINRLCRLNAIEYGTSPRYGWLTPRGERLKAYIDAHTADEMVMLVCSGSEEDMPCAPDYCNCDRPEGAPRCINPFWTDHA